MHGNGAADDHVNPIQRCALHYHTGLCVERDQGGVVYHVCAGLERESVEKWHFLELLSNRLPVFDSSVLWKACEQFQYFR
eukprot:1188882-Prorocentrum_minimum.AAC.3